MVHLDVLRLLRSLARPGLDQFVRPDGTRVDSRTLRHGGVKMGDVLGRRRVQSSPKHRYVHFEGAANLRARCRFEFQPYPKRPDRTRMVCVG